MSKLEEIIKEIGKRQMERYVEKSAKHQSDTKYDVASDNYDWSLDSLEYWENEINHHIQKWEGIAGIEGTGREITALLDLMNVIVARIHKLELEREELKRSWRP